MNIVSNITSADKIHTAREWARIVAAYAKPNNWRSIVEIVITILPFAVLWALTAISVSYGFWPGLILTIPAAGFLLRIFVIQHDCGHGSFFSNRQANNWTGRIAGVLTFTPYQFWNYSHKVHHMGSGSLTRRGLGDIKTLTIDEYKDASRWDRLKYRLYRNPLIMFGLGPAYIFLLDQRLPLGRMRAGWQPWASTMGTNVGIAAASIFLIWLVGWKVFLIVQLPITLLGASAGVWLFYVQHQFEDTVWEKDPEWDMQEAALYGSSHYDLPQPLRWFTGNIGLHHIHHLSSRIPYYRLPGVLRDHPELRDINRMTLLDSLKCIHLALWDDRKRVMVPIRAAYS